MTINIRISRICSAFDESTIGTKVLAPNAFRDTLSACIANHDVSTDRVPGQHYIVPKMAETMVRSGVGKVNSDKLDDVRFNNSPANYVLRMHRGRVEAFLHSSWAAPVKHLAVIVYTAAAYCADPEVTADEVGDLRDSHATHVVVAVLAAAGPPSQLTPHRFTSNLAGGNKEADGYTLEEIRTKAADITEYYKEWAVVADPELWSGHLTR